MIVTLTIIGDKFSRQRGWAIHDEILPVRHRIDGPNSIKTDFQWFEVNDWPYRLSGPCGQYIITVPSISGLNLKLKDGFCIEKYGDRVTEEKHLRNIKERYK